MKDRQLFAGDMTSFAHAPDESGALFSQLFSFLDDWTARYAEHRGAPAAGSGTGIAANRRVDGAIGELAAACYAARRRRDRAFADLQLFGEPAWDILLDVAAAEGRGERLQVTSVCIGACVPETTALRWIGVLEKRGLLRREHDLADQRRSFLRLTADGARRLKSFFVGDGSRAPPGPFMLDG